MALVLKDRVKVTATTTGTGTFTLGAAATGFQGFSAVGSGNVTYYTIALQSGSEWEVGVGTVTDTGGGVYTLSRTTVLESSSGGTLVNFSAGTKDVFVTYPAERAVYLDSAGSAVTTLDIGTLGTSTANITTANITAGTVSTTPASANDLVNKSYVDAIAAEGISYHAPVKYEVTTGNLNATYNNGSSGVGATLTNAGTLGAFTPDGVVASVNDRILVYTQTNAVQNGVYVVTTVGNGSTAWVLTRASDADTYGVKSPTALGGGDAFFVTSGNTGAGETYVCNNAGTITFGTTPITFAQISSAQIYSAGTGLTLTGTTFSLTPVGTAGTYGSASQVPVITTNATGQVTSVTNTSIAINAAAVSGLAPSATTDTTNAANITSGTLGSGRLTGSYTGITGVGTLTAGTWNGTAIGATYGGTGQTSYTQGDLLYATSSSTLGRLADVVSGNALISGGVGGDPAWGKIGLQTHVDGTLQVTNGGTGATTLTGYVYGNGTGAMTASTTIPNSATTATSANTASAIVARDSSGNFSAGTITATLNGNASTATSATSATTATNLAGGVAGAIPYQSGSGATAFSAAGTSGQVLQSNGTSAPTWVSPSVVNDGTLTMNVSGTGLSGSATFTANQSGNSTFTVTSNATSLNNPSTLVARDASGNFSAGTITASLSGNASTATTATTATNQSGGTVNATTGAFSGAVTLSGGTANGVAYLNGSKVLTTGSDLNWDGSKLGIGRTAASLRVEVGGNIGVNTSTPPGGNGSGISIYASDFPRLTLRNATTGDTSLDGLQIYMVGNDVSYDLTESGYQRWMTGGSEQMRLTSTGLGIGTSSPGYKLDVVGAIRSSNSGNENYFVSDGSTQSSLQQSSNSLFYNANVNSATNGQFIWRSSNAYTERMRLDSSGNLGLGVTPSAWGSGWPALQVGSRTVVHSAPDGRASFGGNYYVDGTNARYIASAPATQLLQANGDFRFFTAPSGTAGNVISFTQAMTLDANGNLGIGTSSPTRKLSVGGTANAYMDFNATSFRRYTVGSDNSGFIVYDDTAGAYRLTVDASGNLGVGTTSPTERLTVSGNIALPGSNDRLVWMNFNNDYRYGMRVDLPTRSTRIFATTAAGDVGGYIAFNTRQGAGSSATDYGTERMRLDAVGNLGIGVSPTANTRLYVRTAAATDTAYYADNGVNSGFTVKFASGLTSIGNDFNQPFAFLTNNAERMRLDASGNLGIGTSSPGTKLDVVGTIRSQSGGFTFPDGTTQTTAAGGGPTGVTAGTFYQFDAFIGLCTPLPGYTTPLTGTAGAVSVTTSMAAYGSRVLMNCTGTVRVLFTAGGVQDVYASTLAGFSRVYKNGVAIGSEISSTSITSSTVDVSVVPGDILQLYIRTSNSAYSIAIYQRFGGIIGAGSRYSSPLAISYSA